MAIKAFWSCHLFHAINPNQNRSSYFIALGMTTPYLVEVTQGPSQGPMLTTLLQTRPTATSHAKVMIP